MSAAIAIAVVLLIALFVYLCAALLKPEWFQ